MPPPDRSPIRNRSLHTSHRKIAPITSCLSSWPSRHPPCQTRAFDSRESRSPILSNIFHGLKSEHGSDRRPAALALRIDSIAPRDDRGRLASSHSGSEMTQPRLVSDKIADLLQRRGSAVHRRIPREPAVQLGRGDRDATSDHPHRACGREHRRRLRPCDQRPALHPVRDAIRARGGGRLRRRRPGVRGSKPDPVDPRRARPRRTAAGALGARGRRIQPDHHLGGVAQPRRAGPGRVPARAERPAQRPHRAGAGGGGQRRALRADRRSPLGDRLPDEAARSGGRGKRASGGLRPGRGVIRGHRRRPGGPVRQRDRGTCAPGRDPRRARRHDAQRQERLSRGPSPVTGCSRQDASVGSGPLPRTRRRDSRDRDELHPLALHHADAGGRPPRPDRRRSARPGDRL